MIKTCEPANAAAVKETAATAVIPAAHTPLGFPQERSEVSRFVPVVTLVLWLGCSVVAALGLTMPYAHPQVAKPQPPPVKVELLNVELSNDPLPDNEPPPATALAEPPPVDAVAQPQLPQAIAVAAPSPAVAFAVPVAGPVRVTDVAHASYSTAPATNAVVSTSPPVQKLTYGQGAGKQPAPEYPLRAQNEGQEGVVSVRFVVAENGRVMSAEAATPSPWPLLNDSAVRVVRSKWRFPSGAMRAYEVAIHFVLSKDS